jgi:lysophospholipase L1-like esterase
MPRADRSQSDHGRRAAKAAASASARPVLPFWKRVLFSLIPLVVLAAGLEGAVRLANLDRPAIQSTPLPEELAGLIQLDRELFWSLRPDTHMTWRGTQVSVNHQGMRGADIAAKQPGELRILSLGESTTFGVNVSDAETYSARLEQLLQAARPNGRVTVINAGVSAYSSFQSVTFLEQRGFTFQPDVVLFYHEVNDYLPTSLRDASNNEIGVVQTDRELYESRAGRGHRALMQWSAVYRWLSYSLAQARIRKFDRPDAGNPLLDIGLPGYALPPLLAPVTKDGRTDVPRNEKALGRRVTDEERRANLERLLSLCKQHGVPLVILHPSYRDSSRHTCVLTQFAADSGVLLFDAFDSLHPPDVPPRAIFTDAWHPGPDGHAWLARDLAAFLTTHVPAARPPG